MWHLDVVVGGDAALNAHDLTSNLPSLGLLNISLLLIGLPITEREHLEVLENIDEGVLPDRLYDRYVGRVRLVCLFLG